MYWVHRFLLEDPRHQQRLGPKYPPHRTVQHYSGMAQGWTRKKTLCRLRLHQQERTLVSRLETLWPDHVMHTTSVAEGTALRTEPRTRVHPRTIDDVVRPPWRFCVRYRVSRINQDGIIPIVGRLPHGGVYCRRGTLYTYDIPGIYDVALEFRSYYVKRQVLNRRACPSRATATLQGATMNDTNLVLNDERPHRLVHRYPEQDSCDEDAEHDHHTAPKRSVLRAGGPVYSDQQHRREDDRHGYASHVFVLAELAAQVAHPDHKVQR